MPGGTLKRVIGTLIFVDVAKKQAVVAVLAEPLGSEDRPLKSFEVSGVKVAFVRVPRSDVTTQTEEWRKAIALEGVTMRELMKAYYREAEEDEEPAMETDSMASAHSRSGEELTKLRAELAEAKAQLAGKGSSSRPLSVPGPRLDEEEDEDDDEDDKDARMFKNLEAKMAAFWPGDADPPPSGGKKQPEWAELLADDSGKQRYK